MTEKYSNLIEDLHSAKRQLSSARLNCSTLETELLSEKSQNATLRQTMESLKQSNSKLYAVNSRLQIERQDLNSKFNQSIEAIKAEVDRKQQEILQFQVKSDGFSGRLGPELLRKQIYLQVEQSFEERVKARDHKIQEITALLDRKTSQAKLQKEKFDYKTQNLQKQLRNMHSSHLEQLQEYADRLYSKSQTKYYSEEQMLIKKIKKEVDQLRQTLDIKNDELDLTNAENKRIQREYTEYSQKQTEQLDKAIQEARIYRLEMERFQEASKKTTFEKQQQAVREKDRQIRKLKNQIQDYYQNLAKRDKINQRNSVENAQLTGQIKKLKQRFQRDLDQRIFKVKGEKQLIHKQLNTLKLSNDLLKDQNSDLLKTVNQSVISTHESYMKQLNKSKNTQSQSAIQKNPQTTEQHFFTEDILRSAQQFSKARQENMQMIATQDKHIQEIEFTQRIQAQRDKVRDIARKFLDMKNKYEKVKGKLEIANAKIVELLRTKIALGSPTAAGSKKGFDFTEQKISRNKEAAYRMQEDPEENQECLQQTNKEILQRDFFQKNSEISLQQQHPHFQSQKVGLMHQNAHMKLKAQLGQEFLSPQNTQGNFTGENNPHKFFDRANRTISSGSKEFYERSLKIKSRHKFKELRCENHSIKQEN